MAKRKQIEGQLSFADFLALQPAQVAEPDFDTPNADSKAAVPEPDTKKRQDTVSSEDDARFEEEFAALSALFDTVKTDDFDPMQFLSPIANAVKTVTSEQVSFAEALERHCSKRSAEKILAAFDKAQTDRLIKLIGGMHDEI